MTSPIVNRLDEPELRIGDQEREQAVEELREQYVLGRLDEQEFQQRMETAFAARTASELSRLVADLPSAAAPVDWRPGDQRPPDQQPGWWAAGGRSADWQAWPGPWSRRAYGRGRAFRYGYGHGERPGPYPYRWGGRGHPYHRMPGFLPLLPIVGLLLFFGSWALLFLLPLMFAALMFRTVRWARFR